MGWEENRPLQPIGKIAREFRQHATTGTRNNNTTNELLRELIGEIRGLRADLRHREVHEYLQKQGIKNVREELK